MKKQGHRILLLYVVGLFFASPAVSQNIKTVKEIPAGMGWANNSINTVIFRKNSLCSFGNTQYISYYNNDGFIVVGKRKLTSGKWELKTTNLKGNVADAHNAISIMADGDGYLHLAWSHHSNKLHYYKSIKPGSLEMKDESPMTGSIEQKVTYPEFHCFPDGNLLFLYRDGQSGQGNLVINRYNTKEKQWTQLHTNLIDGERERNAYWQACVDAKGTIHLSWVWRESSDVASNHDMCYARSTDGGLTWENSKGEKYQLPINATTAEYVCRIPQKSELINQTSMYADNDGSPIIASYWKETGDTAPQYHIIYNVNGQWQVQNLGFRKTTFSLSGAGTKRIPISRPQVVSWQENNNKLIAVIFRDEERGNKISVAVNSNGQFNKWKITDLTLASVGSWEPTYDTELWKNKKQLNLFVQFTEQQDAEGKSTIPAQPIKVLVLKK
ncbi:MAG TPA: BNR repeat-containing protein [Chitinophagaceae bacterium]